MSDPEEQHEPPSLPTGGFSLGGLGAAGFDHSLSDDPYAPTPTPDDEALALPHAALVAFRKSGGMRFSSRGVLVSRTGWVEPLEGTAGRKRRITDEALSTLERLLLQSGLTRVSHRKRKATPDGYSYEIAARVGGKLRQVTLDDPVPEAQERLVRVLQRLLPR